MGVLRASHMLPDVRAINRKRDVEPPLTGDPLMARQGDASFPSAPEAAEESSRTPIRVRWTPPVCHARVAAASASASTLA